MKAALYAAVLALLLLRAPIAHAAGAPDLSFDLFSDQKKDARPGAAQLVKAEEVARKVRLRRQLLVAHQAIGFATLGALAATLVLGQLNYMDLYVNGDYSMRYRSAHLGLGAGTAVLFGTTGLLALLAPNPYKKPLRLDTALVHKVAMALATAGMATMIVLGPVAHARDGHSDQAAIAAGHLATGYATFAFMATGVIAYFF